MAKSAVKEYFSEARIELAREVRNHPELINQIGGIPADDFEQALATIAAYVNIVVDGYFTQRGMDELCDMCTERLRKKRQIIIH